MKKYMRINCNNSLFELKTYDDIRYRTFHSIKLYYPLILYVEHVQTKAKSEINKYYLHVILIELWYFG